MVHQITKDSIEEKTIKLQERKKELFDRFYTIKLIQCNTVPFSQLHTFLIKPC